MTNLSLTRSSSRLVLALLVLFLAACSPQQSVPTEAQPAPVEPTATRPLASPTPDVRYKTFTLPGPRPITFELPEGWDFWGNAGWLSPDNGQTFASLRLAWIKPDQDAERLLFNEDAVILEQSTVTLSGLEMHRYTVEVYRAVASTGERSLQGYELVYAFPAPDPELMAGVAVSAPALEDLDALAPAAEHMALSLQWGDE